MKQKLLFLSPGGIRGEMAAAFARDLGREEVDVRAGNLIRVTSGAAGDVLREVGLEPAEARPSTATDISLWPDVVVAIGDDAERLAAPFHGGPRRVEHWNMPYAVGATMQELRLLRDQIQQRVAALLGDVVETRAEHGG